MPGSSLLSHLRCRAGARAHRGGVPGAMIWFRGTWPRFRYDQLMNIGWKRLIPLGMAMVLINAAVGMLRG